MGSPLKKQRPSMDQSANPERYAATQSMSAALDSVLSSTPPTTGTPPNTSDKKPKIEEEEEL